MDTQQLLCALVPLWISPAIFNKAFVIINLLVSDRQVSWFTDLYTASILILKGHIVSALEQNHDSFQGANENGANYYIYY